VTPLRVLGLGSPAGDDQVGWLCIEALEHARALAWLPSGRVSLFALDRPGAGLLHYLEGAKGVILIDALAGDPPGVIHRLESREIFTPDRFLSSHGFGVAFALNLARELKVLPPKLVLYGVTACNFTPGLPPCTPVQAAVRTVAYRIQSELLQWCG